MLQVRYPQPLAVHRMFWSGGTIILQGSLCAAWLPLRGGRCSAVTLPGRLL